LGLTLQNWKTHQHWQLHSLLTLLGKVIKIELITSFWVCPQVVSHDMLSIDGVRGWPLVHYIPNFRNFQLQFQHGNFSRNILYDHSLSVATSLKTLKHTCPYKNIRKAQRQLRLIFQCFFLQLLNREIVIISPTNCQTKWAHICNFLEGEEELQACVRWSPRKSGEKEKEINFIFFCHICKIKWLGKALGKGITRIIRDPHEARSSIKWLLKGITSRK
jgi:hypothetical protein